MREAGTKEALSPDMMSSSYRPCGLDLHLNAAFVA